MSRRRVVYVVEYQMRNKGMRIVVAAECAVGEVLQIKDASEN